MAARTSEEASMKFEQKTTREGYKTTYEWQVTFPKWMRKPLVWLLGDQKIVWKQGKGWEKVDE